MSILEICVSDFFSVQQAVLGGAQRIELCDNLSEGGTTPSYGMIKKIKDEMPIRVHVLIRPRGGDFLYSNEEFEVMKQDIMMAKTLNVDGIVCGILLKDGNVDVERTKELVELSAPLSFTFHRAFDMVADAQKAIEDVIACGAHRLLTSGLKNTALEGAPTIALLNKEYGSRLKIMPAAGITPDNINEIKKRTNCNEFHASARAVFPSLMEFCKKEVFLNAAGMPEFDAKHSSEKLIVRMIKEIA